MPTMSKTLNSSEAVFGFAGWLTSRDEVTTMSATHDAAAIAELVKQFCETNDLPEVTAAYPENLTHPARQAE